MREVAAVVEVQAHEGVAGIQAGKEHGGVGLCAGVRLHVGIFGSKEFADTVYCQLLYLVNNLTSTVVAVARISFSILVGEW